LLPSLGDHRSAVELCGRAISIRTQLIDSQGQNELIGDNAWAIAIRAHAKLALGDLDGATQDAREAVGSLRQEVEKTGRADLESVLNWATKTFKSIL